MNRLQLPNTSPRYIAGIDGGGTKTACMIADTRGETVTYAVTEGSNHQISGLLRALENVCQAIDQACVQAGISRTELSFVYLGMAGADSPEDFELLQRGFAGKLAPIPFKIVNDVWIAFACEAEQNWGAVTVCGTGANLAVRDPYGKEYSVRALRYMLGNYGGGNHLAEIALHYAFCSDEHTGPATRLAEALPGCCDCGNMEELAQKIYRSDYQYHKKYNIPKLVFDLAWQGDSVCTEILTEMGTQLGAMVGRLIRHAGLEEEQVPVVLAGSQYVKDLHRLMIRSLERELCKYVPAAKLYILQCPPVVGAVLCALEEIGTTADEVLRLRLRREAFRQGA